jgi:glycosyltransferase involved in cell wall biosynthesis
VEPDYSIVIPAYNEERLLPRTLRSVRRAMDRLPELAGEVVVADNASTDRTAQVAAESGARVVHEPHRQIARARNAGAAAARGRYLIFLDADTTLPPRLLRRTLAALESGRFAGGGAFVASDRRLGLGERLFFAFVLFLMHVARWAAGSYAFCLREAFEGVGGFDERYYASEEIHFSRAVGRWGRRRGLGFLVLPDKVVTSARKLDWLGLRGVLRGFWEAGREPGRLFSREGCAMWYERPDESTWRL